jgi:uncharacterized protein
MTINPNMILPVGTKIVVLENIQHGDDISLYEGMVGVVQKAPLDNTHQYVVRFPDGGEFALKRRQFAVQKQYHREGMERVLDEHDLYEYVIYRCIVGSRAFGLDSQESDIDRRGIYLPPAALQWSLFGVPEQLERGEEAYWELQKFLALALKGNPNILECLHTPLVEYAAPIAEELIAQRQIFMSKLLYQTYNGYVLSQFKKMKKHLEHYGSIRWKHAMHLIRLLISGISALETGTILVEVGEHRDELLKIRREEISWEEVELWRLALHKQFDEAYRKTSLPDRPDYEAANAFLIHARHTMVEEMK